MVKQALLLVGVVLILVGCQSREESASEDVSTTVDRTQASKAKGEGPFVGEHQNLSDGDTAVWNAGLEITISDVHRAPNENRRIAESNRQKQEARGKPPAKKSPAEEGPEELIVYTLTITNNGNSPVAFNNEIPCEAADSNGLPLRMPGIAAEQRDTVKAKVLHNPVEPGQTREGVHSFGPPPTGTTFEIVCAHPPQQGGRPKVAQLPETAKASWSFDYSSLEFRDV